MITSPSQTIFVTACPCYNPTNSLSKTDPRAQYVKNVGAAWKAFNHHVFPHFIKIRFITLAPGSKRWMFYLFRFKNYTGCTCVNEGDGGWVSIGACTSNCALFYLYAILIFIAMMSYGLSVMPVVMIFLRWCSVLSLQWRHNEHDGVSNHQPHDCLLNCIFRRRWKKTSKRRVTGLCEGIHQWPVNSPHKGPVTRKMFPFEDVIIWSWWRHAMETLSTTLSFRVGYPPLTGGSAAHRDSNAQLWCFLLLAWTGC